jgi:hypothetical protein
MAHEHLLRDIHAFEAMARNALGSAHTPRRPMVEELNRIAKDFEDGSKEDDAARTEKLIKAGFHVEREWGDEAPPEPVKEVVKPGEPTWEKQVHTVADAAERNPPPKDK